MSDRVPLSTPDIGELEESYVVDALRSGWVAPAGPAVDAFEREVAERCGVDHAVAVSSGTAALHLALIALGVGPGQLVAVPTLTFAATANAAAYIGAEPVFVDVDPRTGNLDPELLAQVCADLGPRLAAVLTVDLFGRCGSAIVMEFRPSRTPPRRPVPPIADAQPARSGRPARFLSTATRS